MIDWRREFHNAHNFSARTAHLLQQPRALINTHVKFMLHRQRPSTGVKAGHSHTPGENMTNGHISSKIMHRALSYPYPRPARSYLFHCATGIAAEFVGKLGMIVDASGTHINLAAAEVEIQGTSSRKTALQLLNDLASEGERHFEHTWRTRSRIPVLAYGSNASPEQLLRKYGKCSQLQGNEAFIPVMKVSSQLIMFRQNLHHLLKLLISSNLVFSGTT